MLKLPQCSFNVLTLLVLYDFVTVSSHFVHLKLSHLGIVLVWGWRVRFSRLLVQRLLIRPDLANTGCVYLRILLLLLYLFLLIYLLFTSLVSLQSLDLEIGQDWRVVSLHEVFQLDDSIVGLEGDEWDPQLYLCCVLSQLFKG